MKVNTFSGSRNMTKKDFVLVSLSCIMIVTCGVSSDERSKIVFAYRHCVLPASLTSLSHPFLLPYEFCFLIDR